MSRRRSAFSCGQYRVRSLAGWMGAASPPFTRGCDIPLLRCTGNVKGRIAKSRLPSTEQDPLDALRAKRLGPGLRGRLRGRRRAGACWPQPRGGSTSAIAAEVFLSEGTVRNHLSAAIGKLGAANRAEAVRIATENGWLS
jgi:hypothetical protein